MIISLEKYSSKIVASHQFFLFVWVNLLLIIGHDILLYNIPLNVSVDLLCDVGADDLHLF